MNNKTNSAIPINPSNRRRRSSSLTFVILIVNIIPLFIMGFGIFYLDKYKQNLIESAYVHLEQEAKLLEIYLDKDISKLQNLSSSIPSGKNIMLIDEKGYLLKTMGSFKDVINANTVENGKISNFAETFANIIVYLNPLDTSLPDFPWEKNADSLSEKFPEIKDALNGKYALAAWALEDSFILTTSAPLNLSETERGALFITLYGRTISNDIDEVRRDIIKAFIIVIILTFLLSIYLSSFIAIPLKKLGRAAEEIRRGKKDLTDLPDMSKRGDEIGELSIILRQMTEALNSRIDAIQNFAADVAHEIKNPITSLRSAIETAQNVKEKPKRDSLLKIMEEDVHRLDRLISDISKHSRLDSELARENFEVVDLNKLLSDIIGFWRSPLDRDQGAVDTIANIDLQLPETTCLVMGKADSLAQVFQNLISNAISFSKKINSVRVILSREEDYILIRIEDQGPGIPEAHLEKIFQRFYTDRPNHHTKGRHSGTNSGLGLSISKQIIEAHKGRIYAENIREMGQITGARLSVILNTYQD